MFIQVCFIAIWASYYLQFFDQRSMYQVILEHFPLITQQIFIFTLLLLFLEVKKVHFLQLFLLLSESQGSILPLFLIIFPLFIPFKLAMAPFLPLYSQRGSNFPESMTDLKHISFDFYWQHLQLYFYFQFVPQQFSFQKDFRKSSK